MDSCTLAYTEEYKRSAQLRAALRKAYFRCRNALERATFKPVMDPHRNYVSLDGGESRYGRKSAPVWDKIMALLVRKECLDAEGFMNAQFDGGSVPASAELYSDRAWDNYQALYAAQHEVIKGRLTCEATSYESANMQIAHCYPELDDEARCRRILFSEKFALTPLFRYCIACSENMDDVIAELEERAIQQYLSNPTAYKESWSIVLPPRLLQRVEEIWSSFWDN